jgi:hypothetical protein
MTIEARSVFRGMCVLALTFAALALGSGRARACGGLFCDRPPPNPFDPPQVAQTGENVVFSVSTDPTSGAKTVEADIQVYNRGPAAQFSWVVPVDAAPTVSVGTDQMFTAVSGRTVPTHQVSYVTEGTCQPEPKSTFGAGGAAAGSSGSGGTTGTADAGVGGVNVVFQGAVGPYDTAVIQSGSADAVLQWLSDNMYYVGDDAKTIIATYVSEGKYFVAVRLTNGNGVDSIQPIVLKFSGSVPCVPLRLTAIAALADMQVNLWVLGASRAVPSNYFEIKLNDARIDWLHGGTNYASLVKAAADEAGGNAFIAEYAGSARIMDQALWPNGRINLDALRAATTPPLYLQQVVAQGLTAYAPMLALLEKYIPEPQILIDMGITEANFYNQAQLYWATYQSSFAPFDPGPITDGVSTAIVQPLMNAQATFDAQPYLTRLSTYISPPEMTKDPLFTFDPDLPTLSNVQTAVAHRMCGNKLYRACEAPIELDLPSGQELWFVHPPATVAGQCPPDFQAPDLAQMPSLAVAYQRAEAGDGTVVMDNTAAIASAVTAHNQPYAATIARVTGQTIPGSMGCGCAMPGGRASSLGAAGLLAALALVRRARRRSRCARGEAADD